MRRVASVRMGFFVTVRITETVYQEAAPRVDEGVLYGVKLLGLTSKNKRRYESKALSEAKTKYEGRKVYVNHPDPEDAGSDRDWNDWAGVIENVQYRKGDGLYGDVVLRQNGPYFQGIIEAATNPKFSKNCGFSHVADGESHFEGDTEIVESIKEVFSVDLVTDPATTKGMYESKRPTLNLRKLIETLPDCPQRAKLIEMTDGGYMEPMAGDESEKPTDQNSQLYTVITTLIKMLGETLNTLAAKKDSPPPAAPPAAGPADPNKDPNANPFADEPEDEEMKPEDKEKIAAFESTQKENAELKAKAAELEAKTLLLESGIEATPARVKALAIATGDDRKELLESWPAADGDRPLRSPALIESGPGASPEDIRERFASLCTAR